MTKIINIALLLSLLSFSGCSDSGYDKERYGQIQRVIDGSTNKLMGLKLADASPLLGLEGVPWDEGYTSVLDSQLRIYHFRGFYLEVEVTKHLPNTPVMWTSDELNRRGEWFVDQLSLLCVDGLTDRKHRMSNIWAETHESFRRRNDFLKTNKLR